jgi:hypothetical protein
MEKHPFCNKYITEKGLKDVFLPLELICNSQAEKWISKSKDELNRFVNLLIILNKYEKETVDYYVCQSIHLSLAACSESIVFSLFNIFALVTRTEASFFDTHIRDYFAGKHYLTEDVLNHLSFDWHEILMTINSLVYSADTKLIINNSKNRMGFQLVSSETGNSDSHDRINSIRYFTKHLSDLMFAIDLIATSLHHEINGCESFPTAESNKYIYNLSVEDAKELFELFNSSEPVRCN